MFRFILIALTENILLKQIMYNSALLENLSLLSEDEIKEFQLFVGSDLHNRGNWPEETRALLALIVRHYPDFTSAELDKDRAYDIILPDKPFVKGKLPKIMTEINQMLKDFIVWKEASKPENEFYHHLEWAKFMRNRGREEKYRLAFEKVKKFQQENNKESPEYFYRNYLVEQEAHEWQSIANRLKDDVNLLNTINNLILYCDVQFLEYYTHTLTLKKLTIIEIPDKICEHGINVVKSADKSESVLLRASTLITRILLKDVPEPNDFVILSDYLTNIEDNLSMESLKFLYTYSRNLCSLIIDEGYPEFNDILFNLYKKSIQENLLYYNGKINYGVYFSIVRVAITLKKHEWAELFLENHKGRILGEPESMEFYYANLSIYYFSLGQYDNALDVLPSSSKIQVVQLIIKRVEIKCYYELKSDLLIYKLDAFKVYISRFSNKIISLDLRKRSLGFINALYSIINLTKGEAKKTNKITQKISENQSYYHEVYWLFEKIRELN